MMADLFIKEFKINWNKVEEDSYLRNIAALQTINQFSFHNKITFFVGENGSGKSTLLEGIAVAYGFSAEGGNRNYNAKRKHINI